MLTYGERLELLMIDRVFWSLAAVIPCRTFSSEYGVTYVHRRFTYRNARRTDNSVLSASRSGETTHLSALRGQERQLASQRFAVRRDNSLLSASRSGETTHLSALRGQERQLASQRFAVRRDNSLPSSATCRCDKTCSVCVL